MKIHINDKQRQNVGTFPVRALHGFDFYTLVINKTEYPKYGHLLGVESLKYLSIYENNKVFHGKSHKWRECFATRWGYIS